MESFVLITSPSFVLFATDVEETTTTTRQRFQPEPAPLLDPNWAFAVAADSLWEQAMESGPQYDIWLIMGGVVTDHFRSH